MPETTTTTSGQFTLNYRDIIKGAITAAISAGLIAIYDVIASGGFSDIDWQIIIKVTAAAGLGYLIKNVFTKPTIVVHNPTPEAVKAVKEGEAKVEVKPNP